MFENWNTSSTLLVERLQSDPRSELCKHGAELYSVDMPNEVRVGWIRGEGKKNACMGRIIAKPDGSIELRIHVGLENGLINSDGPLMPVTKTKKSDLGMGKVLLSKHYFPDAVFDWIECASRYTRKRHNIADLISKSGQQRDTASILIQAEEPAPPVDPEEEFREGQRKLRIHYSVERNVKAAKQKKSHVLAETGALHCEACGFDFHETYGELGKGFAECHHRTPIHTLTEESIITLDQLAIVCSNCHRMLHRPSLLTVEQLRDSLNERDSK